MQINIHFFTLLLALLMQIACKSNDAKLPVYPWKVTDFQLDTLDGNAEIVVGAQRIDAYLPILKSKKIALVVNQTSMIGEVHLVDSLLKLGVEIVTIFAPEHGFRGEAEAGEQVKNDRDTRTNLPIMSLYGKKKKPSAADLAGVQYVVFDIQDVGARFYTYISTLHYVMEACAENQIPLLVLDRPNPNGHFVDGNILEKEQQSFVGMHPIPTVHGLTMGELAQMINGEKWLKNGLKCDIKIIPCEGYNHRTFYELPIKPSPNLGNMHAIYLYPSLCFFEGTAISVGRGTDKPFQQYGHPDFAKTLHSFTPQPTPAAKTPLHQGKICYGFDFSELVLDSLQAQKKLNLSYIINAYRDFSDKKSFFLDNNFLDLLAGTPAFRYQIINGLTEEEIRAGWQKDLKNYKLMRKQYLLYEDFE